MFIMVAMSLYFESPGIDCKPSIPGNEEIYKCELNANDLNVSSRLFATRLTESSLTYFALVENLS